MVNMSLFNRRSPLTAAPLRTAGQSIEEEIFRVITEDAAAYISLGVFMTAFTAYEWYRCLRDLPPKPMVFSILTVLVITYCVYKTLSARRKIIKLRLGRDGEKAVGEFLDRFREKGYRVFHDIVGGNFNIDML